MQNCEGGCETIYLTYTYFEFLEFVKLSKTILLRVSEHSVSKSTLIQLQICLQGSFESCGDPKLYLQYETTQGLVDCKLELDRLEKQRLKLNAEMTGLADRLNDEHLTPEQRLINQEKVQLTFHFCVLSTNEMYYQ